MEQKNILILHGWGSRGEKWNEIKGFLEKADFNVVAPDLPGFGANPAPDRAFFIEDYEKWVINFIKTDVRTKNWMKFSLIGHSFGGALCAKISADYPELIEKEVLIAPAIIREKNLRTKIISKVNKVGKKLSHYTKFAVSEAFLKKMVAKMMHSWDYSHASISMQQTFKNVLTQDLRYCLDKIQAPTLIIFGTKDEMVPVAQGYILRQMIKGSKLVLFPKEDHRLYHHIPDLIAKEIIQFFQNNI